MKFETPLIRATLIRRYKRFLADVTLENGDEITAHCPNTGSMKSCGQAGDEIYLSYNPSPRRKLDYTWEMTRSPLGLTGIHTGRSNGLVAEAIRAGKIPQLAGYQTMRREVRYQDRSRIDLLLSDPRKGQCWIEIKNVTLLEGEHLYFPDAVTARGLKHLKELQKQRQTGDRCILFLLINRPEGVCVRAADHIDPDWSKALWEALGSGVEIMAYRTSNSCHGCSLTSQVPFDRSNIEAAYRGPG